MAARCEVRSKGDASDELDVSRYLILEWGTTMRKWLERFLWTPQFWFLIGLFGCLTGLFFQRVAGNGLGLWFMGHVFFCAAYIERQEAR
jgi:hypothetical protein